MNRRTADTLVGTVIAGVVLLGIYGAWQSAQHARMMGGMMNGTGGMIGFFPVLYVFGTLTVIALIGGVYLLARDSITESSEKPDDTVERSNGEKPAKTGTESAESTPGLLDALPEDERRILEPVVSSPGITQIELRNRSEFSKAKVSQTVSGLEQRGLLYRERQGRTYRIYPDDRLKG